MLVIFHTKGQWLDVTIVLTTINVSLLLKPNVFRWQFTKYLLLEFSWALLDCEWRESRYKRGHGDGDAVGIRALVQELRTKFVICRAQMNILARARRSGWGWGCESHKSRHDPWRRGDVGPRIRTSGISCSISSTLFSPLSVRRAQLTAVQRTCSDFSLEPIFFFILRFS